MFIWINRSLGLPYMEQVAVRKVGESDTSRFKLFGLLWWLVSYIHVDDVGESGPFSVTFYSLLLSLHGKYVTLSSVLFMDLVRSWLDNQDASLNGFFC